MKFDLKAIAICATVFGMTLAFAPAGIAGMNGHSQQSVPVYAQNSETTSPTKVDDATLRRTAKAYVKVRDISVKAEQAIKSTSDTVKKQQLAEESESEKVAAVKGEGMEPQQYNNVIQLVKNDNGLQQKFLSYVQELKHSS